MIRDEAVSERRVEAGDLPLTLKSGSASRGRVAGRFRTDRLPRDRRW